ncbi:MAG: hypothetical protein JO141_07445 [Bradyrhizobium sp.]|nr:hypothetical protein [Bradyrhizobium sp.]
MINAIAGAATMAHTATKAPSFHVPPTITRTTAVEFQAPDIRFHDPMASYASMLPGGWPRE